MRYLVGFAFVLPLVVVPVAVGAQGGEGVVSEEPALKLEVDSTGLEVAPSGPQTGDVHTLEEPRLRLRGARAGIILSSILLAAGAAAIAGGVLAFDNNTALGSGVVGITFGSVMVIGGAVGMGYSAKRLRDTKRQLELESAGGDMPIRSPSEAERGALEELRLRKRRAAYGFLATTAVAVAGVVPLVLSTQRDECQNWSGSATSDDSCRRLYTAGNVLIISGTFGMIATGILLGVRKGKERRGLRDAQYGEPGRVRWDLAQSRVVF